MNIISRFELLLFQLPPDGGIPTLPYPGEFSEQFFFPWVGAFVLGAGSSIPIKVKG